MTTNSHLIALHAVLSVGPRSASALAESGTDPEASVDELLALAAASVADVQQQALVAAQPLSERAVEATARLERLTREQDAHTRRRDDVHGPFHADRLWLGSLPALLVIVLVVVLGGALVATGFDGTQGDALLVLALTSTIGAAAGNWAGRARSARALKGAAALLVTALAAAGAVGALHEWPLLLFAVDLAVTLTAAGAGFLAGRGTWIVPPLRASDRQHTVEMEMAQAAPAVARAAEAVATAEAEFAATVEQIAARVLRAVEEYIGRSGSRAALRPDELRERARQAVASWPRRLELGSR